MDTDLTVVRQFWQCASGYPPDKEKCYPDHAIAHEFDRVAGQAVLEYGCGGGSDTMSLLRRGCTVWFADVVITNVRMTMARVQAAGYLAKAIGVPLMHSDKTMLPDGTVDVVNCHGVLHHIEDPRPVLDEFVRVLKPGGRAAIMLYTEGLEKNLAEETQKHMARGLTQGQAFGWATDGEGCPYSRSYTVSEGTNLLESAGLKVESTFDYANGLFRTFRCVKPAAKWRLGSPKEGA